jgi:hypothetical protein
MKRWPFLLILAVLIAGVAASSIPHNIPRHTAADAPEQSISYDSYEYGVNTGSNCVVSVPANTEDGDLLVVILNNDDASAINPSGWTQIVTGQYTAVTMGSGGGMLLFAWGGDDSTTVVTPPADMTQVYIGSPGSSHVGGWYESVDAGDHTKTITLSGGNNAAAAIAVGLD